MKQNALKVADYTVIDQQLLWHQIDSIAFQAVGQLFVQGGQFNWLEPYRQGPSFENVGSCFIIDNLGHLVTSWHVIDQATSLWVQLPCTGRAPLKVLIKSVCPEKDIALLQLHKESIVIIKKVLGEVSFLSFGDSDTVARADNVMILGYPLMQYHIKSTTGIVSGKEMIDGQSLIQITAPINPGVSGGPVFDRYGQVIGITSCLVPDAQNIGFCVPSQDFLTIQADLMRERFVKKPMFGVQFVTSNDSKAELLNNPLPAGLYVSDVFEHGLFADAGIQKGDMIYEIDGCVIDAYGDARVSWSDERVSFYELIGRLKIGQQVAILLYRKGEKIVKKIKMKVLNPFAIVSSFPGYDTIEYVIISGLVVMSLTENHLDLFVQQRPEFGFFWQLQNRLKPALVITTIVPNSYAYQLRIFSPGDLIDAINDMPVHTMQDLKKALKKKVDFLTITTTLHLEQVIAKSAVDITFGAYALK
ncbi:PDZ domain-containing protein [Candidatus Dependentiae bacterium]|nr:MAG: PDZ domain-containing protein [Candidatus Dependentiae bacterium]